MNPSKPSRAFDYLDHMLEAVRLALAYVEGLDKSEFDADRRTQQAVVMNLMVIGEAASRLAERHPEFVRTHPHVPWNSMRGMRNRLAHGYFDINMEIVWQTLQRDLPGLGRDLQAMRDGNPDD